MTVADLVVALVRHVNFTVQRMSNTLAWISMVVCLLLSVAPILVRAYYRVPVMGSHWTHATIFGNFIFCQFFFSVTLINYLRVIIVDFHRRCSALRHLEALSGRVAKAMNSSVRRVDEPILALDSADNVLAWLLVRRLTINMGLRYYRRLQSYTSQALVLTIGVAVGVLGALVFMQHAPANVFAIVAFAVVGLGMLVLLSVHMLLILYYGASTNAENVVHSAVLKARKVELLQAALQAQAADDRATERRLNGIALMLDNVADIVQFDAQLEPVCVLGVPATFSLIQAMLAGAASAVSASIALLPKIINAG
ncbi:hypothetical protein EON62_05935 [archaeon]|nr:MAG: hypothetical protein EON62_05935 [archaeon]